MVKLTFTRRIVAVEQYGGLPLKIIRLIAYIQLLKGNGMFTERFEAIVDTGAHTSVIPKGLWETLQCKIQAEKVWLSGINDRPECRISASIGEVTGIIIDDENHHTEPLNFTNIENGTVLFLSMSATADNMAEKADNKTRWTSFPSRTLSAHCGQGKR